MLLNLPNVSVPFSAYLPVNYIYRYVLRQVENHLQKLPKKVTFSVLKKARANNYLLQLHFFRNL